MPEKFFDFVRENRQRFSSAGSAFCLIFLTDTGEIELLPRKELQSNELEHDIAATKQDIQRIQENIDAVSTDEGVRKIARDKLGLVGAGEYVFQDVGN